MFRAGLLSETQVLQVQAHAEAKGVSSLDAILAQGLADEDTLVAFLHNKLMIPRLRAEIFDRIDTAPLTRVPPELARRFQVLPISDDDDGNLTLAMADPTDAEAVRAVAEHSGAYIIRAVASSSHLKAAIERAYAAAPRTRRAQSARAPSHRPPGAAHIDDPTSVGL